jgi:hypothetical protein
MACAPSPVGGPGEAGSSAASTSQQRAGARDSSSELPRVGEFGPPPRPLPGSSRPGILCSAHTEDGAAAACSSQRGGPWRFDGGTSSGRPRPPPHVPYRFEGAHVGGIGARRQNRISSRLCSFPPSRRRRSPWFLSLHRLSRAESLLKPRGGRSVRRSERPGVWCIWGIWARHRMPSMTLPSPVRGKKRQSPYGAYRSARFRARSADILHTYSMFLRTNKYESEKSK